MAGTFTITTLVLLFTAARTFSNVTKVEAPEDCKLNVFNEFWKNHTKMWTIQKTDVLRTCEWFEPKNITGSGLDIMTHFKDNNTPKEMKEHWIYEENATITRPDPAGYGQYEERIIHQNVTCAVIRVDLFWFAKDSWWNVTCGEQPKKDGKGQGDLKKQQGAGDTDMYPDWEEKCCKKSKKKDQPYLCNSRPHHKLLADDKSKKSVPKDCIDAYNNAKGTVWRDVQIYKDDCE
uniref:Putative group i salivary lipocalin n=1 Tax=Rhipicephalus pulchellus TaxID=72859 RepID=L7M8J4_RHIPC